MRDGNMLSILEGMSDFLFVLVPGCGCIASFQKYRIEPKIGKEIECSFGQGVGRIE